jgi:hypothetical protein
MVRLLCASAASIIVTGVKCSSCDNVYRSSCPKLVANVIIVNDSTSKSCVNDDVQNNIEDDVILMGVLKETPMKLT